MTYGWGGNLRSVSVGAGVMLVELREERVGTFGGMSVESALRVMKLMLTIWRPYQLRCTMKATTSVRRTNRAFRNSIALIKSSSLKSDVEVELLASRLLTKHFKPHFDIDDCAT